MKYLKLLLLLLVTLLSTSVFSISASILQIKDTTVERGRVYSIPVYGSIPDSSAKEIKIEFVFNAMVIDVKQVIGANHYGLPLDLAYNIDINNLIQSKITITSSSFKKNYSGIICELEIEGLAGLDTLCNIEPVSMLFDDVSPVGIDLIKGTIKVNSVPVEPKYHEGISQNYPNPYSYLTTFPFSIDQETGVNFKMYSLNGKRLNEESDLDDIFQMVVYDENGKSVEKPDSYRFTRGSYKIVLIPYSWKLSSGAYFLIMKTDNGVYRMNFIYIK